MALDFAALDFASWEQAPASPARPARTNLASRLQAAWQGLFDSYRPERHYMRGPGPKSLAKLAYAAVPNRTDRQVAHSH